LKARLQDSAAIAFSSGSYIQVTMPNLDDFLSRIQTDHAFYLQFRQNPEETLTAYELSAEERAALTKSRGQLWARLGQLNSYWKLSCNYVLLGLGELEFSVAGALSRPEIQSTIDQVHKANTHTDRLAPVLALMEQIG
jgi:hypothetical protein